MDFGELLKVMAPAVGILVALGGGGAMLVRWLVKDAMHGVERELASLTTDVRVTLSRLETTVKHHESEIGSLKARVDTLRDDKAGRGELDLRVQVEVQREVGKILAAAGHK
jgi:hypothetical protein